MNIDELRTFVEVADTGGVTPAARRLGLSKSVVSRRLARLEAALGVQLLARTTRGAALTEAGITFRDHAAKICSDIDIAQETILPAGDLRGLLRVAAPLTFGSTHFAPVITALAQQHPQLHVHTCYSDRMIDLIAEGFDCGIWYGRRSQSSLPTKRVGPMSAIYVASPAYIEKYGSPETPEEMRTHQALLGNEVWPAMDGDTLIEMKMNSRFKADAGIALVPAALAGLGIAGLPVPAVEEHLASGSLVPVMTRYPVPDMAIYVSYPPNPHPLRKVRVLTEMLIERFGSTTND
ncbi:MULTISPECIES: LysR family transcriptional regulator [Brevundimonas]|uniref:LysR family transcriptional regulator n=1 Tax=Brevundimonas TaxID=41275 RepID=UPI00046272A7|nr:LysR family transcriptional regulator [Brevundimonas naejangsanensis]